MSILLHLGEQCADFVIRFGCNAIASAIIDETNHAYMELVFVVDGLEGGSVCLQVMAVEQDTAYEHPDDRRVTASLA